MDRIETARRVRLTLKKLQPPSDPNADYRKVDCVTADGWDDRLRTEFPVAELILILLRDFLGIEEYGPFEKMRWGLTFDYSGVPFAFELRKFGLALISPREHPLESALTQELVGKLKKAIVLVERHLSEIAERQTAEGNVTILNLFGRLDARYRFFREQAAEAYVQQESRPDGWESASPSWSPARDLTARAGHFLKYGRAAFHFTGAMIDAYFSRTEHLFILLLRFWTSILEKANCSPSSTGSGATK